MTLRGVHISAFRVYLNVASLWTYNLSNLFELFVNLKGEQFEAAKQLVWEWILFLSWYCRICITFWMTLVKIELEGKLLYVHFYQFIDTFHDKF